MTLWWRKRKSCIYIHLSSLEENDAQEGEEFDSIIQEDQISDEDELLYNYFFANIPNESEEMQKEIIKIFQKNSELMFDTFLGFLQKLCQKMQSILVSDLCGSSDIVRFHFRYLADRKSSQYLRLCTSFSKDVDRIEYDVSEI